MKIVIAQNAGFCFGVERAIEVLSREVKKGKNIYTLGEIIHNPQTVEKMRKMGVIPVKDLKDARGIVALPSHGVKKEIQEKLKREGVDYVDATCPYVKKIQRTIEKLVRENYYIIMVGDKNHPEVLSTMSYCPENRGEVVTDAEEIKARGEEKVAVLAQTTMSVEKFKHISEKIMEKFKNVFVVNTICKATIERQKETVEMAKTLDCIIIVGGRKSANTRRLKEIAEKINQNTYFVESPEQVKREWFSNIESVGIIGGASTPHWVIEGVAEKIKSFSQEVIYGIGKI